jgi:hypothetical protein
MAASTAARDLVWLPGEEAVLLALAAERGARDHLRDPAGGV